MAEGYAAAVPNRTSLAVRISAGRVANIELDDSSAY